MSHPTRNGSRAPAARAAAPVRAARRDLLTGGITVAAILIFAATGSRALTAFVALLGGSGGGIDAMLASAVLLNIALMLFGWRRYRDLSVEVVERAAAEDRARTLAANDPLTGLLNRRSLAEGVASLLGRAEQRGKTVAMLMIDLDHFKTVNDLHGHATGDALLRAVAIAIEELLPPNAQIARLGGDEFACAFLYDAVRPGTVDIVAERIVARLAIPFEAGGVRAHITGSLGIARSDQDCTTGEALMRRADIAMYAAKKAGRNRLDWFDPAMERELHARNAIEAGLRAGIPKGEIVPYYEQQIDLVTGRINGFEVLARWEHPTRGLIPPDMFIPVAEDAGLIGDLSLSVMRQAFEEARGWDQELTLSVNISPAQLKDPWLAQKIVKLLVETGYPPQRLEIEITETSLFENLGLAQSIVGSLKNQGIRLALDDFGTGYSSLAHLRALPFDRIKIDKSFVMSMVDNSESAAIVNAITKLGDSLGLPITAEGIEDGAIAERLKAIGCHKGQGYHYGHPIPITQVRKLLADRSLLPSGRAVAAEPARTLRRTG
ncbi:putative bifunctional diguanylate cyclase/phosphodiesterase [Sphingomonas profundi]|uniref:putative bifunctional diguanylate cyclase/phosphodiesterase n=1 Tax=Alterirhizorhabdus profundi TaxID=2681549 RepID=UPI0012E83E47|nr:EAL domain-containing protein [Sphingomonas profundi]